ncbi:S-layer homology domain-containing protein [Lysinibacillus macroides]|uniref:S-layer homology domain-containing protein n=1 Tax=Lysinibacillus macroides TaxID=33935 RepID=UPI0006B41499|nr:S-layer homology domain-containing protein [Lysinibacillus macroides]QPR66195.1 S-layer homology domain-containing protein [Lysinibacillus macroides]
MAIRSVTAFSDRVFHPADNITRAQLAKISANWLITEGTSSAKDVASYHWSASYIVALERAGITLGDNRKFHPEASMTRTQLVAFYTE